MKCKCCGVDHETLFYIFIIFFNQIYLCIYRVFGTRRCSRCMASISSSELVMRARHLVFHIRCFSCAVCNTPLTKGDQFGMRDSSVFCRWVIALSFNEQLIQRNTCVLVQLNQIFDVKFFKKHFVKSFPLYLLATQVTLWN